LLDGVIVARLGFVRNDLFPTFSANLCGSSVHVHIAIGVLVFPDFQLLDASGPISVFEVAHRLAGTDRGYQVHLLSAEGGLVRSSAGVSLATIPFAAAGKLDTLIIAGGMGTRKEYEDGRIIDFISRSAEHCRRVASVCTGAFLLARTGLLNGLEATTHWRTAAKLQQDFPGIRVLPDRIWVNCGKFWSSAGVSAGVDLSLALVAGDHGTALAQQVAREIVVYYRRPGGQSQFSSIETFSDQDDRFAALLGWVRENIGRPFTVDDLAERVAMSTRNFARQFRAAVGQTPAKVVEQIRLESARQLVETTDLSIDRIAQRTGFDNSERMRRAFVRAYGRSPRALRTELRSRT
jgi:transcriptional regulator GlxA family with amidase domain